MKRLAMVVVLMSVVLSSVAFAQDAAPPKGRFSGLMYFDYFYNAGRDTGIGSLSNVATPGVKDFQGFQFRRIYFTYDYDIAEQFTTRFRLEADQAALSSDGKVSVFVKDAFLRWKHIFTGSDLTLGFQPTAAYEISETFWNYRALEKTVMDLRGVIASRDLGVSLRGKLDDGGVFNYWLMLANNSANKPETDKYKRYSVNVWIKPDKNFQASVFADYKAASPINDAKSALSPKATLAHGTATGALFLGYSEPDQFTLGAEAFVASTAHGLKNADTTYASLSEFGVSVFATVALQSDLSLIGRYDYFDPNSNSAANADARNLFLISLAWRPAPAVAVMPNAEIETYQSPAGHSIDPSVTGRLTFSYNFQ